MRTWTILLAGLILWAAHFFLAYGIGEFAGDGKGPRVAIGFVTLAALAAVLTAVRAIRRLPEPDGHVRWRNRSALFGLLIGGIAIVFQTLPAFFPG